VFVVEADNEITEEEIKIGTRVFLNVRELRVI
jgi:hypothetical protein